ncbi:MAG: hypothetical protein K0Q78_905 [Cellvibrio sp.]|jgi:hypothetical protein|nr:hypothetical protein [Cellvibrio sp.]
MTTIFVPEPSIENHAAQIRASGILARSMHLHRVFEYLYQCYTQNRTPKELEIAIEGMGRENDFDVSQDAVVRVYVHKLRRKLDEFYEKYGKDMPNRLKIPKGEYRLILESRGEQTAQLIFGEQLQHAEPVHSTSARKINIALLCTVIILLNIIFLLLSQDKQPGSEHQLLRESQLWKPVLADERPVLVVVGDYFIFAESDVNSDGKVKRLVREFDLNSPMELANYLQLNPQEAEFKFDIGLSYLPTSTAYALNKLSPILNTPKKAVQVILASQLNAEALRNSHIVYIGYLSGLGLLSDAVSDVSGFRIGSGGFDELVDTSTGKTYVNSSGSGEHPNDSNHLAYLASFSGPTDNRIIAIAGFRDAGLIELTDSITNVTSLAELNTPETQNNFEAIYQANGFGQATAPAKLVAQKPIKNRD